MAKRKKETEGMSRAQALQFLRDCAGGPNLTFNRFQIANKLRQTKFVNKLGKTFKPYNLFETAAAAMAEAGELTNFCKKIRRGDFKLNAKQKAFIGKEIADTITYLCLVANKAEIDLTDAVAGKFNEVSDRVKSDIKL